VPRTYEELLDPQWKGKLAWRIGSASGAALFLTNLRLAWGEEKAQAYFLKLREQKIVNFGSGSARTLVDRVVAGEYPIALQIFAHHPLISKAKGAAVNSQLLAPVPTTAATMVIPKGLRHPYAAMLLVDYILSKEGQTILLDAEYFLAHPDERTAVVPAGSQLVGYRQLEHGLGCARSRYRRQRHSRGAAFLFRRPSRGSEAGFKMQNGGGRPEQRPAACGRARR
jgi:iron(III) transport system substrate-binding protein